jgi:hypothetical protein
MKSAYMKSAYICLHEIWQVYNETHASIDYPRTKYTSFLSLLLLRVITEEEEGPSGEVGAEGLRFRISILPLSPSPPSDNGGGGGAFRGGRGAQEVGFRISKLPSLSFSSE